MRAKANHQDLKHEALGVQHRRRNVPRRKGFRRHSGEKHKRMYATIDDSQIVLARGMGRGAYHG